MKTPITGPGAYLGTGSTSLTTVARINNDQNFDYYFDFISSLGAIKFQHLHRADTAVPKRNTDARLPEKFVPSGRSNTIGPPTV